MNLIQKFGAKLLGLGNYTPFESTGYSTARSYIYPPPLDQRKQIQPYTRIQLLENYHWLRNNVGLVRRLTNGTARYAVADGIRPKSMTADPEWNKAHDEWWEMTATNKSLTDLEGEQDFYRMQRTVATSVPGEGELFTNIVDPAQAGYTDLYLPLLQLIPAASIKGVRGQKDDKNVFDGLVLDDNNRVTGYRLPTMDGKPNASGLAYTDLPAEDVIHTYDPERVGQRRGITWLYHGINSLIDILDLTSLEKHAAKVHSALAAAVKNKTGTTQGTGLTGQLESLFTKAQAQANGQANPQARNKMLEKIFGGGIVPFLGEGEELELLASKRPSPVFTGFLDWLVRDIAWGYGTSPEFIWSLAGMGGANTRTILADAQSFFDEVATLVIGWSEEIRRRRVASAMLANQRDSTIGLPPCKDPLWMHKVHWKTPQRVTADIGKEGKLAIDLLGVGMNTLGDWWGGLGFSGRDKIDERIDEVVYILKSLKEKGAKEGLEAELTYDKVFPGSAAKAPPALGQPPSEKPAGQDNTDNTVDEQN